MVIKASFDIMSQHTCLMHTKQTPEPVHMFIMIRSPAPTLLPDERLLSVCSLEADFVPLVSSTFFRTSPLVTVL